MKPVIDAFHDVAQLCRADIFLDDRLTPTTALEDAHTPACGWLGQAWTPGCDVMVGINPGGGGDNYRRNPMDDRLYSLLRAFRDSDGSTKQDALLSLSREWIDIQRSHNIWRLISALLTATGRSVDQFAFLNVLPFRTRNDGVAPAHALKRATELALMPQLEALAPSRIFALGLKAYNQLRKLNLPMNAELIALPRTIGDSYLAPATLEVLSGLRSPDLEPA